MSLTDASRSLRVPPDFRKYASIQDANVIESLEKWKIDALATLQALQIRVLQAQADLTLNEKAGIISAVAPLSGDGAWVSSESRLCANAILHEFIEPNQALVGHILLNNVKPIFRTNAHPSINPETGRKLARPAGGPQASQDFYDSQTWKDYPGASLVVLWCVQNIPVGFAVSLQDICVESTKSSAYEEVWHLVIPPIMTLLDDYEAPYKLSGVMIAAAMLRHVPGSLLKRTGVDSLLLGALSRSMTVLDSPETPLLLPAAVSGSLDLIKLTTADGSVERFDQLCALLGDGIIGSVWPYSSNRIDALLASIESLRPILEVLGLGCARYLKVLVAQLVYPLAPLEHQQTTTALQISSLRALSAVIKACPERIANWRGTILNGVARSWVDAIQNPAAGNEELKKELQIVCHNLAVACPTLLQHEYRQLAALDENLFGDLFSTKSETV
ncbi:hypothetical protein C8F01DRAFT_1049818 [Mycena amicta]|nr:hypothetical protein C8F01DRAFT_1049818 [Mycena amicta]